MLQGCWTETTPDGILIRGEPLAVTVNGSGRVHGKRAVAEATAFLSRPGAWYLNRVFIEDVLRRQGLGGQLVEYLKKAVVKQGGLLLLVEPGGYGSDPEDLRRFYMRHGFQPDPDFEGENVLVWRTPQN